MTLDFGNRCGHCRLAPALEIPKPLLVGPGGHPRILSEASARVETYYDNPDVLPSLGVLNPSSRSKRSERRESAIRLLKAILKFLDLPTLQIAVRREGAIENLPIALLAKHASLELRRAERALRDLGHAGLVTVIERRSVTPDGEYRSSPALKRVSPLLFGALGLGLALHLERAKARKRLNLQSSKAPPPAPPQSEQQARQQLLKESFKKLVVNLTPKQAGSPQQSPPRDPDPERHKRWMELAVKLRDQHPDWPADDIRAAASRAMRN